jgi:hypothetical protein
MAATRARVAVVALGLPLWAAQHVGPSWLLVYPGGRTGQGATPCPSSFARFQPWTRLEARVAVRRGDPAEHSRTLRSGIH